MEGLRQQRVLLGMGVGSWPIQPWQLSEAGDGPIHLLSFSPSSARRYGMTIVEAASQGTPSLVQGGGGVGATDLLSADENEVICCDLAALSIAELADVTEGLIQDRQRLASVGRRALVKARSWTERANAEALVALVQGAVAGGRQ